MLADPVIAYAKGSPKVVLNLGCGSRRLETWPEEWTEVRVDLDPGCNPDYVADLARLPFPTGYADGIFCDSCLEHVTEGHVGVVLAEWHRVLRPGGFLYLRVPDLEAIAELVVAGRLQEVVYRAGDIPIRPLDMLYGLASAHTEHPLMIHRMGFTAVTLSSWLSSFGFSGRVERIQGYELWVEAQRL